MAAKKSPAQLREEARALIEKVKKQEQDLLKQAKEMEEEIIKELGGFVLKLAKSNTLNIDSINSKITELGL